MNYKKLFTVSTLKRIDYKTSSYMVLLGIILFYAFTRFIDPGVSKIAQVGLGISLFYMVVKNPDQIRRDPMFLLFIAVIVAQMATWASVEMFHPDIPGNELKLDRLGKLFLFLPIAWGLQSRTKWVPIVFLTAWAGFAADLIWGCDFLAQVAAAFGGRRVDFGVRNAQHPSMVFGLMVIISAFYMAVSDKKVKTATAFMFFVMGLAGLTATQTRQTFLGIIVAALVVFIGALFVSKLSLKKIVIYLAMMGVLVGTASYSITIHHRQIEFFDTINVFSEPLPEDLKTAGKKEILAYYISKQNNRGSGLRLKLWLGMLPYMSQNPWLGWGSSSIKDLIENSPFLKGERASEIGHLHNYHITLFVCYGVLGFFLVNGIYVWLLVSGFRIRKQIPHGNEWFLLTAGFMAYWLVVNSFENFNGFWTGVFCHNLILGCIYAHYRGYIIRREHQPFRAPE